MKRVEKTADEIITVAQDLNDILKTTRRDAGTTSDDGNLRNIAMALNGIYGSS